MIKRERERERGGGVYTHSIKNYPQQSLILQMILDKDATLCAHCSTQWVFTLFTVMQFDGNKSILNKAGGEEGEGGGGCSRLPSDFCV